LPRPRRTPIIGAVPASRCPVSALNRLHERAHKLLEKRLSSAGPEERQALLQTAASLSAVRDVTSDFDSKLSFGDRLADRVASFGGSWTFITLFGLFLLVWVLLNTAILLFQTAFDPYPFIFLNLMLSMIAAVQAPIIMMSQNRQAARDRVAAANDYEINIKAEVEIMALHEKLDRMRSDELHELIRAQGEEIAAIRRMLDERGLSR
jgi:uncharacterized membrane protein